MVSWLYVISILVALAVSMEAWRMRAVRGAREFAILSSSVAVWCLGYLLGFFNSDLSWKLIFLRIEYAGIISSSYFWLVFIATYVDNEFLRKRRTLAALAIIPLVSFVLVLTITHQHIFYSHYGLWKVGDFVTLRKTYGAGFYVEAIYAYLLVAGGAFLLLHSVYQMPDRYRNQFVLIGVAILIILVPNFLYVMKTKIFGIYDPTPVSFAFAGIIFSFVIVKYRFLDVVPTAYRQVFKSVNSGIIVIDGREQILDMNPGAESILSCTSGWAVGKKLKDVCVECAGLADVLEDPEERKELQLGKEKRIYSVTLSPMNDSNGEPVGGILVLYDVTDLRNALDEIDTFAHSVAHDLKTPLSLLTGYLDLLSSDQLTPEERDEAVNVIRTYSAKMIDIVDELLILARVRREQGVAFTSIDMAKIVRSSVLRLERLAQEKKGKVYYPDNWPVALGYAPWIEEVWVNYLSNALKYGGPSPNVYLGCDEVGRQIKFWVKDNGPGLKEGEQHKLFREFSRLSSEENEPGHGLGLFIAGRIVSKLGGEVGVESEPGSGAKFYFTLPKACASSDLR